MDGFQKEWNGYKCIKHYDCLNIFYNKGKDQNREYLQHSFSIPSMFFSMRDQARTTPEVTSTPIYPVRMYGAQTHTIILTVFFTTQNPLFSS